MHKSSQFYCLIKLCPIVSSRIGLVKWKTYSRDLSEIFLHRFCYRQNSLAVDIKDLWAWDWNVWQILNEKVFNFILLIFHWLHRVSKFHFKLQPCTQRYLFRWQIILAARVQVAYYGTHIINNHKASQCSEFKNQTQII